MLSSFFKYVSCIYPIADADSATVLGCWLWVVGCGLWVVGCASVVVGQRDQGARGPGDQGTRGPGDHPGHQGTRGPGARGPGDQGPGGQGPGAKGSEDQGTRGQDTSGDGLQNRWQKLQKATTPNGRYYWGWAPKHVAKSAKSDHPKSQILGGMGSKTGVKKCRT